MLINQFQALSIKEQASTLKAFRAAYNENRAAAKQDKLNAQLAKQQAKALKQEQSILRAQLRLQKLLDKQAGAVGAKAAKANRKPGKATVTYGAEANQIASAIMAKKASA